MEEAEAHHIHTWVENGKPLFCHVTDMFNGTCRFFAVVFTTVGIILAFMGKLTAEYVALVGSIQALLVGHSIGQDYHERNSDDGSKPDAAA
jgi:hypothetical protein